MRTVIAIASVILALGTLVSADEAPEAKAEPKKQVEAVEGALPKRWSDQLTWRSIGPANMGGRITSLAVSTSDAATWWAASAGGGLLKTTNDGTTFEHQFDQERTASIGDVAVAPSNADIVYVGTGESNPRNSVSWGNGVYRSDDGGKTWVHKGLDETFQISAVRIHPENPDTVFVGAMGRCWGTNEARGLFKTTDGGATWEKILYVDDKTGVIDVQMNPADPDTLLVATWERQRDGFDTNAPAKRWGPGSAVWKTTDGGATFKKITDGLPSVAIGRIGIDFHKADPNLVVMVVETEQIGTTPPDSPFLGLSGKDADVGSRLTNIVKDGPSAKAGLKVGDIVLAVNDKRANTYQRFIKEIRQHASGDVVKIEIVRDHETQFVDLTLGVRPEVEKQKNEKNKKSEKQAKAPKDTGPRRGPGPFSAALGGQRADMQDEQGKDGHEYGGVFKSTDGGDSWARINSLNPRPMYFSEIRIDPQDPNILYVLGMRLWKSKDGGDTFTPDGHGRGVHVDHHALWIDPADPRHVILGNDGGMYVSRDRMANWDHLNHVAIGQFYHVGVGPRRDYRVYGGLQDNGSWGGPSRSGHGRGPTNSDWIRIGGGDGFRCLVDENDPDQIYFESQNGRVARRHLTSGESSSMQPRPARGTKEKYRFNWYTPFVLSKHNSRIYYTAGNHVFRSLDRGNGMRRISPEITASERGSATALAESPRDPGRLYVGTDDGGLWTTSDGGHTWTDLFERPQQQESVEKGAPTASEQAPVKPTLPEQNGNGHDGNGGDAPKTDADKQKEKEDGSTPIFELMPERRYVSWIEPSRFKTERAYLVFDGHRSDDDRPHLFVTENGGRTWRPIVHNLPASAGTTRVLREDPQNQDLLYLGTEFGAWVSIDRGRSWTELGGQLPTVAVHAFAIHQAANEVVAATHGRSLWVLDVGPLRQMIKKALADDVTLFRPNAAVQWRPEPGRGAARGFVGRNPVGAAQVFFHLKKKVPSVSLKITSLDGTVLRELEAKPTAGLQRVEWDLRRASPPGRDGRFRRGRRVGPGTYKVVLEVGGQLHAQELSVQIDPDHQDPSWIAFADAEEERQAVRARDRWLEKLAPFQGED